ncbi:phospho-sugar mutase [Acidaminobacter hydrogenoformans]|uniref:Phosphoglucomutase n=1 Tax=Acidaminobacter hydrogenoformans DSM 2784 TaxID=1120920 RepID=A0A1G5S417_9FIRM|nr:phospho-sugar mutase [Acidaminobacter hydrogenoformans]SCZ80570.1 phosphoglucomutase [Acidaminobacter hydrogenoformans DSM 2784]
MDFQKNYQSWLESAYVDAQTREELQAIADDKKEIEERFYKDLEFGTGGMRGIIGAGTNRMNRYVIRKASQGFARYILERNARTEPAIVIAYDTRRFSKVFALEAALVMAANGIKAYTYEGVRTTPELSFAVRHLNASAGIVITASHNPPEYNGYKVYGEDGCQLVPEEADKVIEAVVAVKSFEDVSYMEQAEAEAKGLLQIVPEAVDEAYIKGVIAKTCTPSLFSNAPEGFKVVFTPLHGTGGRPVVNALNALDFKGLIPVQEQMVEDSEFTTIKLPNPEEMIAYERAVAYAEQYGATAAIATDPDCDRVGVVVRDDMGQYIKLTGNQTGGLLLDYMISQLRELPKNPVILDTIVTSDFGAAIAKKHGIEVVSTLTGFKFIGEKIRQYEDGSKSFLFGYEESYGYLIGTDVRDKDAVISTVWIIEMLMYYYARKQSLLDRLDALYREYGYHYESLVNLKREGKDGMAQIAEIMSNARNDRMESVAGLKAVKITDFENDDTGLPKSDVVKYELEGGTWFAIRPSGTEPKLKIYVSSVAASNQEAQTRADAVAKEVQERLVPAV